MNAKIYKKKSSVALENRRRVAIVIMWDVCVIFSMRFYNYIKRAAAAFFFIVKNFPRKLSLNENWKEGLHHPLPNK